MDQMDNQEQDTEKEILTRWDRLKKWWEIFKFGKFLYGLLFVVTGALTYGEVTETTPIRDAAVQVGIIDETVVETIIDEYQVIEGTQTTDHSHPHTHDYSQDLKKLLPKNHNSLH